MISNMAARKKDDAEGREAARGSCARRSPTRSTSSTAHGVEMNQRYKSDAVVSDGSKDPGLQRRSRARSTSRPPIPGARLPHVWVEKGDAKLSIARSLRQGPLHADHLDRRRRLGRGGEGGFEGDGPRHPHRQDRARLRLRGPLWRLGARPRGGRQRLRARPPGPARRMAREEALGRRQGELTTVFSAILGKTINAPPRMAA